MFPRILITVGTTEFDDLLKVINTTEFCHVIKSMGCQSIAVQFGRGQITPSELVVNCEGEGIRVNDFRFSSSMEPHILQASLVISHAGAGSIIETLNSPNKPFLIVILNLFIDVYTQICKVIIYCRFGSTASFRLLLMNP